MTPQYFKERWENVAEDRLVAFPETALSDVRISADVRAFLILAGLPSDAAPSLSFALSASGTLQRVSDVWRRPAALSRYRIIGSNGSGDPVCFDEEANGEIVYLNHDDNFRRMLMAKSVFSLAECLPELRDLIAKSAGDTQRVTFRQYDALLSRIREIDPAAVAGGYWPQEINTFRPARDKSLWQFWKK